MYVTSDIFFAAALVMAHSAPDEPDYVTIRMDRDGDKGFTRFTLDIPEDEGRQCWIDYKNGQLGVSDLQNFKKRHADLVRASKDLRDSGEQSWVADPPLTSERMDAAQQQGEKITAMRAAFERQKRSA